MYHFKLQTVLDHRQFIEDNLKKELVEIRQQYMAAENVREQLNINAEKTAVRLKEEQADGLPSDQVVAWHHYMRTLSDQIRTQIQLIAKLIEQIARKQAEVLEAMKNRQMLEKLKERGIERYDQEMLRKEMEFINEIAVNQYARRQISGEGEDQG